MTDISKLNLAHYARCSYSGSHMYVHVHVRDMVVLVNTPVEGAMAMLLTFGARFSTVTVVLSVAVPPFESVAVAVQVTMSVGIAEVVERSKLEPV